MNYIRALDEAVATRNNNPLINLVGAAVERSLDLYLETCRELPEEIYQSLVELAANPSVRYSRDYLGWLLRHNHLEGERRRGRWYTSLGAIKRYQDAIEQQLVPRGRPPTEHITSPFGSTKVEK